MDGPKPLAEEPPVHYAVTGEGGRLSLEEVRRFLLPVEPEKDAGFCAELERLGRRGLRVIGWVEIVMPLLGATFYHLLITIPEGSGYNFLSLVLSILLGVATMSCAQTTWGSRYSREIGVLSGVFSVWLGLLIQLHMIQAETVQLLSGSMSILVVILVGLAVLPLKPVHGFTLGMVSGAIYYGVVLVALRNKTLAFEHLITEEFISVPLVVLMYTALTAVSYERLAASWQSRVEALEAAEDLRRSESRTLIAESAAGMNRLAAAVSHELNSPLGAMKSAAETLPLTMQRLAGAEPPEREKLVSMAEALAGTISASSERMQEIVGRMQRFTNLDRAEVLTVDVNQLIADVAAFITAESSGGVRIETEFGKLPRISCRPQQLSAVFSSLLHLASGRAGAEGSVQLRTQCIVPNIEIAVSDSGPKLSPQEITRLFDPEFRVSGDRVTTGDWNLFAARRLVHEAGGDMLSASGNTFLVTLPCPVERM
jgi:signal transduction histidine kinase